MPLKDDSREAIGSPYLGGGSIACEVLVVGAGPAGCSAARAAAAEGAQVVIIDRRPMVGQPARCAGYVPTPLFSRTGIGAELIAQPVDRMLTHHPGGIEDSSAVGYIINRDLFDRKLAAEASAAGARVITGCRAAAMAGTIVSVCDAGGGSGTIDAELIVGADGPLSAIGRMIGVVNSDFASAAQWLVGLKHSSSALHVYFERELPGGYGWLFPRGELANVGIAIDRSSGYRPATALRRFTAGLAAEGLISLPAVAMTGGLIPVGGPLACRAGNVLLAGDAAGHCHPVTGAGIATAVQCGELAGQAAAARLGKGTDGPLGDYEEEVEDMFGEYLRHAASLRRQLYDRWSRPANDISQALARAWPAFPEYVSHHDR